MAPVPPEGTPRVQIVCSGSCHIDVGPRVVPTLKCRRRRQPEIAGRVVDAPSRVVRLLRVLFRKPTVVMRHEAEA